MSAIAIVLNGQLVSGDLTRLSVLDRGFLYGDGVSETLRARRSTAFMLDAHLLRLRRSCAELALDPPTKESLEADAALALSAVPLADQENVALRFLVTRGASGVGMDDVDPNAEATVLVTARPIGPHDPSLALRVMHVNVAFSGPFGAKMLSYAPTIAARARAKKQGFDDVLHVDAASHVIEGGSSNIVAMVSGRVRAPQAGALAGITRGVALDILTTFGLTVDAGPLTLDELRAADEAFLTSSLRGIARITQIDDQVLPGGAPVTEKLQAVYLARFEHDTDSSAHDGDGVDLDARTLG